MSSPPPLPPQEPAVIKPPASPLEPMIVLVIAFFLGGIAYFLYGQWQKGAASLAAYVGLAVLGLVTCGWGWGLFGPLWILTMVDAFMQAQQLKEGRAIRQWTWFTQSA
jgi:hypothetical protein